MTTAVSAALLSLYAEHIAPFVRHDDNYGNILLPSVIGNQKGRLRAIINRRPFFLYKAWALSSPESLHFLKRQEEQILKPLSDAFLETDSDEWQPGIQLQNSTSLTLSTIAETIFRFLVVSSEDQKALRLAGLLGKSAGLFIQRCSVLLSIADRSLLCPIILDEWKDSVSNYLPLFGEADLTDGCLPGETRESSELIYSLFKVGSGAEIVSQLLDMTGDLRIGLERRSVQSQILYCFEALLSSGKLFAAFQLMLRLKRSGSDQRMIGALTEECMRVALINDRPLLYKRLSAGGEEEGFRLRYFQMLYGNNLTRIAEQLIQRKVPGDEGSNRNASELHDRFESLMLSDSAASDLSEFRKYLAVHAGDDYRMRTLLGRLYEEKDPETALFHYSVSSYPALRRFQAARLRQRLGRAGEKRDGHLRKMLESSSGDRDHGSGELHER